MWAGEQGTERTSSAPVHPHYPATYMMLLAASACLKCFCAFCLGQKHCCMIWICLTYHAALPSCTRASCLAGSHSPHQCMPQFRWRCGLIIWTSTAHPLLERWLRSHCIISPIRYAVTLAVHASRR